MAKKTKIKKRNEVFIRISDIPKNIFESITINARAERRTNGKEVLTFLEQNNYSTNK